MIVVLLCFNFSPLILAQSNPQKGHDGFRGERGGGPEKWVSGSCMSDVEREENGHEINIEHNNPAACIKHCKGRYGFAGVQKEKCRWKP